MNPDTLLPKQRVKGLAAVTLSAVFFGFMPLFTKTVYAAGGNAYTVVLLRSCMALVPLFFWLKLKKVPMALEKKQLPAILLTALGFGGTSLLLFSSYNYIPTGMATTIHFVYPVLVILGSMLFFGEKPSGVKVLCILLCTGGILLFYDGEAVVSLPGIVLAFLSGATYALYVICLGKSSAKSLPPLVLIFYMNLFNSVLFLLIGLPAGNLAFPTGAAAWLVMVGFSLGSTFVAVQLFQIGVRLIGPQNAAILSTMEPITSLVVGALLFSERFTTKAVIGCLLILASVVLVTRAKD